MDYYGHVPSMDGGANGAHQLKEGMCGLFPSFLRAKAANGAT